VLRKESWVTQFKEVAKAFSHKASLISMGENCAHVTHNGQVIGYLHVVEETIGPDEVIYLRDTAQTHWQTQRDLRLRCVAELPLDDPPQLTEEEIKELRRKVPEGSTGFVGDPDES
jgi:hypothetical protein